MKISSKQLLIGLVVLDLVAIGCYAYVFNYLQGMEGKFQDVNRDVASYENTNQALESIRSTLDKAEAGIKQVDSYYIPSDGVVDFISQIESLAKSNGLSVSVDSVGATDYGSDSQAFQEKLSLRVETSGSWSGTERFISLLENLPVAVNIDGLSVDKVDNLDPQGSSAWKGEFEISAPKLK